MFLLLMEQRVNKITGLVPIFGVILFSAVTKGQGQEISPGNYEHDPGYFETKDK